MFSGNSIFKIHVNDIAYKKISKCHLKKKILCNKNWKLERYQNNMVIGVDYLT